MVWSDTEKLDRARRSYAQKVVSSQGNITGTSGLSKNKVFTCKFYQEVHVPTAVIALLCSDSDPLKECKSNKNKNFKRNQ